MADEPNLDGGAEPPASEGFVLREVFPDANSIFEVEHLTLDAIKGEATVAVDTNVLLAPYKIGSQSFQEFTKILKQLSENNRIVVPAHVAREYAKRRQMELSDLVKNLRDQSSRSCGVTHAQSSVLDDDIDYKKAKDSSAKIEKSISEARKHIDKVISKLSDPATGDPIFNEYKKIFAGRVIEVSNISDEELKKESRDRYAKKIPPGYKDSKKKDNSEGDYLIWKSILDFGKSKQSHLIFVTGDEKGDWYTQGGGGAFQPRFELVSEYASASQGRSLHIIPLHALMKLFGAPKDAVEATREVQRPATPSTEGVALRRALRIARETLLQSDLNRLRGEIAEVETQTASLPLDANEGNLSLPWNRSRLFLAKRREELMRQLAETQTQLLFLTDQ